MKNKISIITLLSVIACFLSCNDDDRDFLEVENRNSLNVNNFWQNQADAESGIYSIYSALQFNGVLGGGATVNYGLRSEVGRTGNVNRGSERVQVDDALVDATNPELLDQWEDLYQIIFRANQVLENVPNIEMDETAKREILGEAQFLRGLTFFWLATTFNEGSIILPTVSASGLEEARLSLSDRATVYSQIFEDLLNAQSNLEGRLNWQVEGQEGRATWGAVTSILGKVYLYEENFTRAKEELLKVINLGEYSLAENIADNFTEEGEFNSESIFEVQFLANLENNGNFGDGEGANPNEATLRPTLMQRGAGGFGFMFTTHFISALYRNEVVNPNSLANLNNPQIVYAEDYDIEVADEDNEGSIEVLPGRRNSLRSEASMAYQDDGTLMYRSSTKTFFIGVFSRGQMRKFMNWTLNSEPRNSGINERIIRYADVLLMYAESVLRDEGDSGLTQALTYIDQVRERSGLVTLETLFQGVDMPPVIKNTFPDSTDEEAQMIMDQLIVENPNLLIPAQSLTATNVLAHLFNKERPAEFAWEGKAISWNDLRRRPASIGTAIDRIQELGGLSYEAVSIGVQAFETDPMFIENSLGDFSQRKLNFGTEDFFFPIPAAELLQNPSLGGN